MIETDVDAVPVAVAEQENEASADLPTASAAKKRATLQRMYFVRLPKPADVPLDALEKEKEDLDAKLRAIGNKLAPLMDERSQLMQNLTDARDTATDLKARIEDLEMFVHPNKADQPKVEKIDPEVRAQQKKDARERQNAERQAKVAAETAERNKKKNEFNSVYGHLGVTSNMTEEDVDAKVSELTFRQAHESLSINEEKQLIKQIKTLHDSKAAIKEYNDWFSSQKKGPAKPEPVATEAAPVANGEAEAQPVSEEQQADQQAAKERAEEHKEHMAVMKKELDELWLKYKAALDEKNGLGSSEKALKGSIDGLMQERIAVRQEREAVWNKLQKHRAEARNASQPFTQNRAFSTKVRELVKKGQVEEAQQLCNEQVTEAMEQYRTDAVYRKEYNDMWDAQVDFKRPLAMYQPDAFQATTAAVIADVLEQAQRKLLASRSSKGTSSATQKEASISAAASEPKADALEPSASSATTFIPSKPAIIPGMEEDSFRPKPKKAKKSRSTLVELPVLDQTEFVPPPAALKSDARVPSEAERREQEKEHNRLAQAEAAQRKERRKQAQEKKKQQKAQRAERAELEQKNAASEATSEDAHGPDTPPVQEVQPQNGNAQIAEELHSAVNTDNAKLKNRSNAKPPTTKLEKIVAPRSRPATLQRKKPWTAVLQKYGRQVLAKAQESPQIATAFVCVMLALVLGPVLYLTW